MFLNYANSPDDRPEGNINKEKSLIINSCGIYRLYSRSELPTCRPKGRIDYQLIYIASGKGYFYFNDESPTIINAGNMILYSPLERQKYIYYSVHRPEIYWLHFSGKDIPELFRAHSIDPNMHVIPVGTNSNYEHYFEKIIVELQLQKAFYQESGALFFMQLLIMMGRFNQENSLNTEFLSSEEIDRATTYFHEFYRENINIESYVTSKGITISSFFRKFKQYTGKTPLQYLLDIRLSNAKKLLETTDYSINEISSIVGYENALYFSRLFHKHIGVSPKEYRKSVNS